jgi:hypothetical protein
VVANSTVGRPKTVLELINAHQDIEDQSEARRRAVKDAQEHYLAEVCCLYRVYVFEGYTSQCQALAIN